MLKNYFKTAWRNLVKSKTHSIINLPGLSVVGMAVAILIELWMWDELSFDKYHWNFNSIAQVMQQGTDKGVINTSVAIPQPLAATLQKNCGSDFKHIVIYNWLQNYQYRTNLSMVDFRHNRFRCFISSKFSNNKGSNCKSCEEFENRMKVINDG